MMNNTAPTLLSALDAIKAERDALRNGQVGRIATQAVTSHPVALPPLQNRNFVPQEHITPQRFKSQLRIKNWKRAFFIMSLTGPALGFLGSWLVLGGLFPPSQIGLTSASAAGGFTSPSVVKADKLDNKESQLTLGQILSARRNCTELVLDSRTGVTSAVKCSARTSSASPLRRSHQQPMPPAAGIAAQQMKRTAPATPPATMEAMKPLRPKIVPIKVQPVRPRGIIKQQW